MEPVVLDRCFRVWRHGIGHSQLLLHARAGGGEGEHLSALFEDVRAVKLRAYYQPLILQPSGGELRLEALTFADIPARHHHRYLCLALPVATAGSGLVVCGRATVFANSATGPGDAVGWTGDSRVMHTIQQSDLA